MTEFKNLTHKTPVDFVLQENKQHMLIDFFIKNTWLGIMELALVLNIPVEKLRAVRNEMDYLNPIESKRLVEYFCMICGR